MRARPRQIDEKAADLQISSKRNDIPLSAGPGRELLALVLTSSGRPAR